jgi:hypothetical protein
MPVLNESGTLPAATSRLPHAAPPAAGRDGSCRWSRMTWMTCLFSGFAERTGDQSTPIVFDSPGLVVAVKVTDISSIGGDHDFKLSAALASCPARAVIDQPLGDAAPTMRRQVDAGAWPIATRSGRKRCWERLWSWVCADEMGVDCKSPRCGSEQPA